MAAVSEAKKRANKKWNAANPYDRISFFVVNGGKEIIKAAAADNGESLNEYVNKAVLARLGLRNWDKKD